MHETTSRRHRLQIDFGKTSVNSRHCEPFTIIEDSVDNHGLNSGEERTYRKMKRLIRLCGGKCDWAIRRIVAYLEMKESTFKAHIRKLRLKRLLVVVYRRIGGCRLSETNVYALFVGEGSEIQPQKQSELNTSTKATREPSHEAGKRSYARERWEHNRKRNHPSAMRKLFELVGFFKAKLRCTNTSEQGKGKNQGVCQDSGPGMSDDEVMALRKRLGVKGIA